MALAGFTNSVFYGSADDTTLCCLFRWPFLDEKSPLRAESTLALGAGEAVLVPLPANCRNDDLVKHWLIATLATGCGATTVAAETPCKAGLLNEGSGWCERLL